MERIIRIDEVGGLNPPCSTKIITWHYFIHDI